MSFNAKFLVILLTLQIVMPVNALENLNINVKQVKSNGWKLSNITLSLFDLQAPSQQIQLVVKQLSLPAPFAFISFSDIQCSQFTWQDKLIICKKGIAKLKTNQGNSSSFDFSFVITDQKSEVSLNGIKFANGSINLKATDKAGKWQLGVTTKNLSLRELYAYLSKQMPIVEQIGQGRLNAQIQVQGNSKGINKLAIETLFKQLSLQANHGKVVAETIDLQWHGQAELVKSDWYWRSNHQLVGGELYVEPVYLSIKEHGLKLSTKGRWQQNGNIRLQQIEFIHPGVIQLNGHGLMKLTDGFNLQQATVFTKINNLELFSKHYILPFIEQTIFEGFKLQGKLNYQVKIDHSAVTQVLVDIKSVSIADNKQRFVADNLTGEINWSKQLTDKLTSKIQWDQLKIKAIPINASRLKFKFFDKQISLIEPTSVPILGGSLDIKQFSWQRMEGGEPKVYFEGEINKISLAQLSYALDWTPLAGNISGFIPGVHYENKTLAIEGELSIQLFDGVISINQLSSSGLFTDFAKLSLNMKIDNLDLYALTKKFSIGEMEGRVSGFVNDLYLENWQPVTFYAWIGTPENDDSNHRISQKAVESIVNIGGGGMADVFSKGFLQFFDTFNYTRLGFGCYLYQGVCQLMGVEAAEQGYYLIKGGGLPRIDIMGYNTRVDWQVLLDRLSRISTSDKVVIE